jgi:hypothetical protein
LSLSLGGGPRRARPLNPESIEREERAPRSWALDTRRRLGQALRGTRRVEAGLDPLRGIM